MKIPPLARLLALTAASVAAFPVTCNSILAKRQTQLTGNEEWEYVTPVGTLIPQRVVKGQQPVLASPTVIVSQESFIQSMEKVQGSVRRR